MTAMEFRTVEKLILDKLDKIENSLLDIKIGMRKTESDVMFHKEKIRNLEIKVSALEKSRNTALLWVISAIIGGLIAWEMKRVLL